ncbi:retron Ec67 family RNA-directed DNA polymerase/endonuclease [Lysobacter sp. A378]
MDSKLAKLKRCDDLADLARLVDFQPKAVSYLIYKLPPSKRYTSFSIPKKSGGQREICAPEPRLLKLQRRIADYLQDCLENLDKQNGFTRPHAHGFIRGRSIMTNASVHRGRRFVLNVDLADFFGTINFGRVRGYLISSKDFELKPAVATTIAQLVCHNNKLPQGAPTSPVIANLVARVVDARLSKLAEAHSCAYTRYADDLTFSTNLNSFPKALATACPNSGKTLTGTTLSRVLKQAGYQENTKKTRLQFINSRQEVTGLTVNKKIAVSVSYRKRARVMVDKLIKTGSFHFTSKQEPEEDPTPSMNKLHGVLSHINSVAVHRRSDQHNRDAWKRAKPNSELLALSADEKVYRQFLFYRLCYANEIPTLLCEGKTDNIYLKFALRRLGADFPKLATVGEAGKLDRRVQFYGYSKTSKRILGLDGGSANLANFISEYDRMWRRNKAPPSGQPCIIVIDNDKGANIVRAKVKPHLPKGQNFDSGTPYTKVIHNLYVVQVPLPSGSEEVAIEDLFPQNILDATLGSKTFHRQGEGFDNSIHYGKHMFAEYVIKKQWPTIDFSGFAPLLDRIANCVP